MPRPLPLLAKPSRLEPQPKVTRARAPRRRAPGLPAKDPSNPEGFVAFTDLTKTPVLRH